MMVENALALAKMGFKVFPLFPKTKNPNLLKFPKLATTDEAQIRLWWSGTVRQTKPSGRTWIISQNSNIGIHCEGMCVIDVDVKDAPGFDEFKAIPSPKTLVNKTTSGGAHFLYRLPQGMTIKNVVGGDKNKQDPLKWPWPHIDIRTKGGYIVAPGSVYKGKLYEWVNLGVPISMLHPGVLPYLDITSGGAVESDFGAVGSELTNLPDVVPFGGRDASVYRYCCSWRARDLSREEAEAKLKELFKVIEQPVGDPFTWEDCIAKLDQAWAYPAGDSTAKVVDPVEATQNLKSVRLWVQITPNPQYEWVKKVIDLPDSDIDIVINDISIKMGITKKTLQTEIKGAKQRAARKIAAAARDTAFTPINARYGWTTIGKEGYIVDTSRKDKLKILTPKTFTAMYSNQSVAVVNAAGEEVYRPLGESWIKDEHRRDFEGIYFHPTKTRKDWYNLYNGFDVSPASEMVPEYIKLYVWHVNNVICSNDPIMVHYIWAWCADLFQHPEEKKGVAVALRGGRGVGKGFFAQPLGRLWGNHFLHLTNPTQLTGRFNSHLASKLLVFVDEAFWSEDKKGGEGVLKGLITEPKVPIEAKGIDVVNVENFCKFIMASNEAWNIPAGVDERRFCCIDVNDSVAKNHKYFSALSKEFKDPLFAPTLLKYLLDYEYECNYVREAPASAALTGQKLHSLDNVEEYWYEILQEGPTNPTFKGWDESAVTVTTSQLYDEYIVWCNEKRRFPISARNSFCKKLFGVKSLCPNASYLRRVVNQEVGYAIPILEKSRESFEKYTSSFGTIRW